jgi:hypothetical protein
MIVLDHKRIMSSWQPQRPSLKLLSLDKIYCKTSTSGYCSNFFNFFMCYSFATMKKQTLYLNDTKNNISRDYHLILDTFQPSPRIEYTILDGLTSHQIHNKEMREYFEALPEDVLRHEAKQIFRFSKKTQTALDSLKQGLPSFDCGIHVRTGDKITTGEMLAIPLQRYIEELSRFQKETQKKTLMIYLMTDSKDVVTTFQKTKDPSWTIQSLPSPVESMSGHDQHRYNALPTATKQKAFYHFLAEVQLLQECPHVICTFSSNIGRFLNLTRQGTIFSLD